MKIFSTHPRCSIVPPVVLCLIFCVLGYACKPNATSSTSTDDQESKNQVSAEQLQAEKVIENDPNVELVEVQGDQLLIQNKYTKRSLSLPFKLIIDGHYPMIQEDKAMAERILKVQEAKKKQASGTPTPLVTKGWGKTPAWIPRYPGLEVSPSQLHSPREDGSIWGYISATHSDDLETIKDTLISEFKKSGLRLTRNMAGKNSLMMIFENSQEVQDDSAEKRKVTCSLKKVGKKTNLTIQYNYGM